MAQTVIPNRDGVTATVHSDTYGITILKGRRRLLKIRPSGEPFG